MKESINRIKVILADKNKTNKWLAEQLGKDPATVSKWCTDPNHSIFLKFCHVLKNNFAELRYLMA